MEKTPLKKEKEDYYWRLIKTYIQKNQESRDSLLDDNELSPEEEAFMRVYKEVM